MFERLRWFKHLFRDLPQQLQLAYCLVRDPRVPLAPKVGVVAALGLVVTPFIDLPESVPLVGELDVLALTLLSLRVFVALCPGELVAEHERLIAEHRSRFDGDVRAGGRVATAIWRRARPGRDGAGEAGPGIDIGVEERTSGAETEPARRGAAA